jgi:hypothetical protein
MDHMPRPALRQHERGLHNCTCGASEFPVNEGLTNQTRHKAQLGFKQEDAVPTYRVSRFRTATRTLLRPFTVRKPYCVCVAAIQAVFPHDPAPTAMIFVPPTPYERLLFWVAVANRRTQEFVCKFGHPSYVSNVSIDLLGCAGTVNAEFGSPAVRDEISSLHFRATYQRLALNQIFPACLRNQSRLSSNWLRAVGTEGPLQGVRVKRRLDRTIAPHDRVCQVSAGADQSSEYTNLLSAMFIRGRCRVVHRVIDLPPNFLKQCAHLHFTRSQRL